MIIALVSNEARVWQTGSKQSALIDGMHTITTEIQARGIAIPSGFLSSSDEKNQQLMAEITDVSDVDRERFGYAICLYKLLNQKYNLDYLELESYLSQLRTEALPDLNRLAEALAVTLRELMSL